MMNPTGDRRMDQRENSEALTCPSCGAPRLVHAWDCAKCGAVFDGEEPAAADASRPETATPPRSAAGPARSRSARRQAPARSAGPARRARGVGAAGGVLTAMRGWVAENKAVAVILAFILYIGTVWLFGALIIGATDSPGAIKNAYRDLTGRPLPAGFGPTFAAHFVSRRLVVLDRPDQVFLVFYKDRDGATDHELRAFTEGALDLFEVPWEKLRTRQATVSGATVEVSVFRLLGEGGPHLYLVPTSTTDGERAIEAVVGAPESVLEVVEEIVSRR